MSELDFPTDKDGGYAPCPICGRRMCDHTLEQRGDGVMVDRHDDDTRGVFKSSAGYGCMLTASGRVFNLANPNPEMVCLEDVAHHLSLACRWACAVRDHYSVAQHSVHVAMLVEPWLRPAAMLHDGHEYVVGDRTRPFKQIMPPYIRGWWTGLVDSIDRAICQALGVDYELLSHPDIKAADLLMLAAEGRDLVTNFTELVSLPHTNSGDPLPDCSHIPTVIPMHHDYARVRFLEAFHRYKLCAHREAPGARHS